MKNFIGEKIKELRLKKGLTQTELSSLSGITIRTIQRIENNKVKPSIHSLKVLGEVLEADLTKNAKGEEIIQDPEGENNEFNSIKNLYKIFPVNEKSDSIFIGCLLLGLALGYFFEHILVGVLACAGLVLFLPAFFKKENQEEKRKVE